MKINNFFYKNCRNYSEGGVVVAFFEKNMGNKSVSGLAPRFFWTFFKISATQLFFVTLFKKQLQNTETQLRNHVTKCNKIKITPDFVTNCYTLLQKPKRASKILLHFVTP